MVHYSVFTHSSAFIVGGAISSAALFLLMKSRDNLDCALIGPQYSWNAALGGHKKPCALSVAINLNLVVVLSLQTGIEKNIRGKGAGPLEIWSYGLEELRAKVIIWIMATKSSSL